MVLVVIGVTGAGKTTVGRALAEALGWDFVDADNLHPAANIDKMARNEPLTDADREPWLEAVRARIAAAIQADAHLVIACSALKRQYRHTLADGLRDVRIVYLKASRAELERRLQHRRGHFAGTGLLASQFATLEEPAPSEAVIVDAMQPIDTISAQIRAALLT